MKTLHSELPLPSNIRQIDGLQVLRAVAVLLVAWAHSGQWLLRASGRVLPNLGIFGIDIFFVISGFIISSVVMRVRQERGTEAMWEFLKRRLVRIFPIYWVFASITLLRLAHGHQLGAHHVLAPFLLVAGPYYPDMPVLVDFSWTMFFEMFFYYTLAAVLLVNVRRAVPLALAALTASVAVGHLFGIQRSILIVVSNPILLEFVMGALVALIYLRSGRQRGIGLSMLVVGVAAAVALAIFPSGAAASQQMILKDEGVLERVLTWGVSALLIVGGVVFWSPETRGWAGRFAVLLGNASYSTYLASGLLVDLLTKALTTRHGVTVQLSPGQGWAYQIFETVAVFAVGLLCYQFVEWPMLRWLQKHFLAKPARANNRRVTA